MIRSSAIRIAARSSGAGANSVPAAASRDRQASVAAILRTACKAAASIPKARVFSGPGASGGDAGPVSAEELLAEADIAMYDAKEAGRGGYRYFTDTMSASAEARLRTEHDLRVGYVSEQPVWRPSYRLIFDEGTKRPMLQAWGIVQNVSGEDWKNVSLSLVAGAPIAFESTLATPVTPQRWRCDLQEVLPMNAMVYSDIGGHMLFNIHHLRIGREQEFLINLGFASMGHGTVAPIGGKMANPDRPVFAIVGDACFTMNGMELLVAAEYDVPVIWIVENNNMHGVTWHGSKKVSGGRPMKSIAYRKKLHVAEIGAAMGLDAYVVDGPGQIQAVVRKALAANRPTVIEVLVDPTIAPPLQDRAEVIGGFGRE